MAMDRSTKTISWSQEAFISTIKWQLWKKIKIYIRDIDISMEKAQEKSIDSIIII